MEGPELWRVRTMLDRVFASWRDGEDPPRWFDVIAARNGWNPLAIGETMTVHINGECFEIRRTE